MGPVSAAYLSTPIGRQPFLGSRLLDWLGLLLEHIDKEPEQGMVLMLNDGIF